MQAKDVMTSEVTAVTPATKVEEIARILMTRRISAVPALDADGNIVGIISEGDLMRRPESGTEKHSSWWLALLADPEEQAAAYVKSHGRIAQDVMTTNVVTASEDMALSDVAKLLEEHGIKRVPIVREGKLVGIVSRANLLHGLATAGSTRPNEASDESLRSALSDALKHEAGVRTEFVNIVVSDGIVHLWGAARSAAEKQAIRVAAENTPGVSRIDDHLGVLSPQIEGVLGAV